MQVFARSFESLATDSTALRFPAPLAERAPNPAGFGFWWKMLEFVFQLPDPSGFPKLAVQPLGPELAVLRRYIAAAEDMAESALLSGSDAFTVRVSDDGAGVEHVDATFTTSEITRGFTTLFRQFDSSKEAAGFDQVQRILRQTDRAAADENSPERVEQLRRWGKARGSLRAENLKVRVGQKLRTDGRWARAHPWGGQGIASKLDRQIPVRRPHSLAGRPQHSRVVDESFRICAAADGILGSRRRTHPHLPWVRASRSSGS